MGNLLLLFCCNVYSVCVPLGGGGVLPILAYTGRLLPEVQPLTLLYTILAEKIPLVYTFY